MRLLLFAAALAVSLSACTPPGGINTGPDPIDAQLTVDQVEARYNHVRDIAEAIMPFLAPATQEKIRKAQDVAERAIAAARIAATAIEQIEALKQAAAVTEKMSAEVGSP